MRAENKRDRQAAIEEAAFDVLEEKGFAGMSVLSVAQRAKASNGTLYSWYGNKVGLFKALVARNAAELRAALETALEGGASPRETLDQIGPQLLGLLLSPRAVALNRAAAADPSGALGAALSEAGRGTVAPLIARVVQQAQGDGMLSRGTDFQEITEVYFSLLIGELQIRVVAGHQSPPEATARKARAARALTQLETLYPA
ncbi:TetR/AcrR family transcriptional regulator [Dinoroseobacter sp. S124A]|uniref:TetR/AcrR family transcriptional regulator n=1 Tax=Dinoroseobacter sp. S124A TaxID=3415128 RepID=UPI003C7A7877